MPARLSRRLLPIILVAHLASCTASAQSDPTHVQLTFSGTVQDGAVSPDGRFLAYVESSDAGDDRLLVRAVGGGEPTELARALHVFHLRWSPSGESLLVGVAHEDSLPGEVRILPRSGGPGQTFEFARWFAWSPDETEFAYAYYSPHALFVRHLATGRVDTLALAGEYDLLLDLDWTRAGDRLTYVVKREPSTYELRVIDRSGDGPRSVAIDSVHLFSPRWSMDGRSILFLRGGDVVRVELESDGGPAGRPQTIARPNHPRWPISFDLVERDAAISYIGVRGPSDLALLDLRSGESRTLTSAPTLGWDLAVSPDGREVAFFRGTDETTSLEVLTLGSGATRTLVSTTAGLCCPAWSPDGREIAYASSSGPVRFWRIPSEGGTPALLSDDLTRQPAALQWASRDRLLVLAMTGTPSLFWIDPESGQERRLEMEESRMLFGVRLSPDGSTLVGGPRAGCSVAARQDQARDSCRRSDADRLVPRRRCLLHV
jgi:Tol biopolymer transport system component